MSSRPSRYLRRHWNHNKPHLAKYSSLPILQLTPTERPIFQCQQCGFINTLIPMCLWCCWTSDAAHEEFYRSAPRRRRRISAPPRVTRTATLNITPKSTPQNGEHHIPTPQQSTPYRGTLPDAIGNVTTPTISARPSINRHHLHGNGPSQSQIHNPTKTSRLRLSIPSFSRPLPSQSDVDRQNPSTTTSKSTTMTGMKLINPKSSRFSLFLDFNNNGGRPGDFNHNIHTHAHVDNDEHTSPILGGGGETQQQRALRRKRRINIVEQAQLDAPSSGPIAISFDLELKEKEDESRISSESFDQNLSSPSVRYPASKELPQTPPHSSSPVLPPSSQTTPTSIRIGHPNRPYYTAIRKNMSPPGSPSSSPPPSRPTSLIGSSPSRPTSLLGEGAESPSFPPSSFHHQRPISLCLGLGSTGMFSPFVIDTNAEEEQSRPGSHSPKPKTGAKNNNNNKKEKAREGMEGGSIGFSMSGETELRMALAGIQQAESGGGEFRYRETTSVTTTPTATTTPSVTTTPTATTPSGSSTHDHHHASAFLQDGTWRRKRGGSISSGVVMRVKAFRKSLKDLIGGPKSAL